MSKPFLVYTQMDILTFAVGSNFRYAVGEVSKNDIARDSDYEFSTYRNEAKDILNTPNIIYGTVLNVVAGRYVEVEVTFDTYATEDEVTYQLNFPGARKVQEQTDRIKVLRLPGLQVYTKPPPLASMLPRTTPPAAGKRRKLKSKKKTSKKHKKTLKRR
jgi:hypothetical protein